MFKRVGNALEQTFSTQKQQTYGQGKFIKYYNDLKVRFAMIGTVGAGKTTEAAKMLITAHTRSQDDPNFFCRVIEHKSNIRVSASNLRRGIFPPKTIPMGRTTHEAGLQIIRKGMFGEKKVHIPILDFAGEDIQYMLEDYDDDVPEASMNWQRIKELLEYLKDSQGIILTLPAPRAFVGTSQMEPEPEDLAADPDVNMSRLLEQVLNYKEKHRGSDLKAIVCVITKYDLFQTYAIANDMDLYEPGGIENFMNVCFPDTNMQLKYLQNKGIVRFFPSHVELKRDQNKQPMFWNALGTNYNGSPIVDVDLKTRKPKYSEGPSMAMFDFLEQFAS